MRINNALTKSSLINNQVKLFLIFMDFGTSKCLNLNLRDHQIVCCKESY